MQPSEGAMHKVADGLQYGDGFPLNYIQGKHDGYEDDRPNDAGQAQEAAVPYFIPYSRLLFLLIGLSQFVKYPFLFK